jgi:phosphoribosyl-ATP pyrophosphohydrolase/phosphoribosyl-AMP cyclohydrolase
MLTPLALASEVDWDKLDGLAPAVVQHAFDGRILMVGYMNQEALERTLESGRVTFWSRSRQQLWTKGETSGNHLDLVTARLDCDRDCLLVRARPHGPTCHRGTDTCFDADGDDPARPTLAFLSLLEEVIRGRESERPEGSYTTRLFEAGVKRIAQKVGEEGVETALAATAGDDRELLDESADLLYHLLVLLRSRGLELESVVERLEQRHG